MESDNIAKQEIENTLSIPFKCMNRYGVSFEKPKNFQEYTVRKIKLIISLFAISYHVTGDVINVIIVFQNSPNVEDVVPLFHPFGYAVISISKFFVVWFKKDVFAALFKELEDIWPTSDLSKEGVLIKERSLFELQRTHKWYYIITMFAVSFFAITPVLTYLYKTYYEGEDVEMEYMWATWYPMDKKQPFNHVVIYLFEIYIGFTCVSAMISSDLLFASIASHICMQLKLLQQKLTNLVPENNTHADNYKELVTYIKIHQKLISYCKDIEEAFSFVNLIVILLNSINLCCCMFVVVLLEPMVVLSNKLYLMGVLIQVFITCWYAGEIFHESTKLSQAAYNCKWYKADYKFRRALCLFIQRSQKPIAFTASNFTQITLVTYASILTRSYSYFTLLYSMYTRNH